jgi:GxxExxY protein
MFPRKLVENKTMELEETFKKVLDILFTVPSEIGPGLPKKIYERRLYKKLINIGLKVEKQKRTIFSAKEVNLEMRYQFDLIVANKILIKIKAIDDKDEISAQQLLIYMRLSEGKIGLLSDFTETIHKTYICENIKQDSFLN